MGTKSGVQEMVIRRAENAASTIDVSILIPALNEERTIKNVLDRVLNLDFCKEIVVVDDGSSDRTPEILADYGSSIRVITNPSPLGKGAALRIGLNVSSGKVVIVQDADLEYTPEEIPALVAPILDGQASVVYGNRFHNGLPSGMALPNKIVNRLLALSVKLLYWQSVCDEATCYKAFRRELLVSIDLQCRRFEFCPEVTAKFIRLGYRIHEVPISYHPRGFAEGKKIRWTDAPSAFWTLAKYRFWRPKRDPDQPA